MHQDSALARFNVHESRVTAAEYGEGYWGGGMEVTKENMQ
jgi:hypothetical protein